MHWTLIWKHRFARWLAAAALFMPAGPTWALEPHDIEGTASLQDRITVADKELAYTATAGKLLVRDNTGEPAAELFYLAYTLDGAETTERPLTFLWDGGPGGSTIAENIFGFGPKRYFHSRHNHPGAPYVLEDNPFSLLTHTDLVFLDPVGTGYSQALGKYGNEDFWGVEADADSMSAAIERYLHLNDRWQSPKFMLGTSYGTTRTSIMADKLQSLGVSLNGVILVASALNFGMQDNGMDQQFLANVPTQAATAWYHGKTAHQSKALPEFLKEVQEFVRKEYGPALYLGNALPQSEREAIARKLSGYTGLDARYILGAHLRVSNVRFRKELLRDQGIVLGRMDSRTTMADFDTVGEEPENDYWLIEHYLIPARSIIEDFLGRELGYETTQKYRLVAEGAIQQWNWSHYVPPFAGISTREIDERNIFPQNTWVAGNLSSAMRANRKLQVFQAHAYFDFATPYAWGEHDLSHMTYDPQIMERITAVRYKAGHAIFLDEEVLPQMYRDLSRFYLHALGRQAEP